MSYAPLPNVDIEAAMKALDAWAKSQGLDDDNLTRVLLALIALVADRNFEGAQYQRNAQQTIEIMREGFDFYWSLK